MNDDENSKDVLEHSDTDLEGNCIAVVVVCSVIVVVIACNKDELSVGEEPAIMNTP